jgi:hypothetical protein
MAEIVWSRLKIIPVPLSPTESKFRVKEAIRAASGASISGPDCGTNQSRASISAARSPFQLFGVFLLGMAVAITDNGASKAALSG